MSDTRREAYRQAVREKIRDLGGDVSTFAHVQEMPDGAFVEAVFWVDREGAHDREEERDHATK